MIVPGSVQKKLRWGDDPCPYKSVGVLLSGGFDKLKSILLYRDSLQVQYIAKGGCAPYDADVGFVSGVVGSWRGSGRERSP